MRFKESLLHVQATSDILHLIGMVGAGFDWNSQLAVMVHCVLPAAEGVTKSWLILIHLALLLKGP